MGMGAGASVWESGKGPKSMGFGKGGFSLLETFMRKPPLAELWSDGKSCRPPLLYSVQHHLFVLVSFYHTLSPSPFQTISIYPLQIIIIPL